jgi:uncharacterized membrane protein (Fun14 family)
MPEAIALAIMDDLFKMMSGSMGNLPSLVVMAVPFVVGLVLGYVVKRILKVGLILVAIALVAAYFGFVNLGNITAETQDMVKTYGPVAMSYLSIFFGIVPLSAGLVIGFLIGFVFS